MSTLIVPERYTTTKSLIIGAELPRRTDSYSPVPHRSVIDFTLENLDKAGLKVIEELYSMSKGGNQATGHYRIGTVGDDEMSLKLAWQNSYDKSITLKWAIGGHVIVCGNGMVAGDLGAFVRKHTGDALLDCQEAIVKYIGNAENHFRKLQADKERMKEIEVTKRTAAELIGRMYIDEAIITGTQLNIIKRELDHPSFDYSIKGTLWNVYNNCTVSLKESHPSLYMKQHTELHKFFKEEYAI